MKGKFFVDSFTTLTPISSFIEVSKELTDLHILLNEHTGEIKKEERVPIFIDRADGVTFRVSYVTLFGVPYLRTTFTSKMLGKYYFNGLDFDNFRIAFNLVMASIKCRIDFFKFVDDSKINDIDFAVDFMSPDDQFLMLCTPFFGVPSAKKFYAKAKDYLSEKRFIGLQLVNRKDASRTTPFVKFYSKKDELFTRSSDFLRQLNYFNILVTDIHRRCEVTLKNRKHIDSVFKKVGLMGRPVNIESILTLSEDHISRIINRILDKYVSTIDNMHFLEDDEKAIVTSLTPTNFVLAKMAYELLNEGHTVSQIVNMLDLFPTDDKTKAVYKSRIKSRLKESLDALYKLDNLRDLRVTARDAFIPAQILNDHSERS